MIEKQVNVEIEGYKPNMASLSDVEDVTLTPETTVQVKADGEMTLLSFSSEGAYTVNRYGHLRMDFPAVNEFSEALKKAGILEAKVLCELYAVENDRPLKLPDFIHYAKGGDPLLLAKVNVGVWDLLAINGHEVNESFLWKMQEVERWLEPCRLCRVLPYIQPSNIEEVRLFWMGQVEQGGYEGLVVRNGMNVYKVKPEREVDAVIIAINKKPLLKEGFVTSIHLALMDTDGSFVELTDCASGIDYQLRKVLYGLLQFKIGEDKTSIYIQPFVICKILYTEVFEATKRRLKITSTSITPTENIKFYSLRHPRLAEIRTDKKVNPQDLRLTQIPDKQKTEAVIVRDKHGQDG